MNQSFFGHIWNIISLSHLITRDNQRAYMTPMVMFAMLSVASGGVTTDPNPSWKEIAVSFPHVLLYMWLWVLYFDCSNQKEPEAVQEDKLNKPWRAIPSGRLTMESAETWYKWSCAILPAASGFWLGGFPEAIAFMIETWIHDYAKGGDFWWSKNIINLFFYGTGQLGATHVAVAHMGNNSMSRAGYEWCAMLALQTLTTIQLQDIKDMEGDAARGRNTMPLAFGEWPCRWFTMTAICFWSVACPVYWSNGSLHAGFILPIFFGGLITIRSLIWTTLASDRRTWPYFILGWLPALYATPLLSRFELLSVF